MQALMAKMPNLDARSFSNMSGHGGGTAPVPNRQRGRDPAPPQRQGPARYAVGSHVCQFYNGKETCSNCWCHISSRGWKETKPACGLVGNLAVAQAKMHSRQLCPTSTDTWPRDRGRTRHYTEPYTNPDGTVKPSDELSDAFAAMGPMVTAEGFEGLRASGVSAGSIAKRTCPGSWITKPK